MPKLNKVREEILKELQAKARELHKEYGNLRLVAAILGKSHTWVATALKDNKTAVDK